MIKHARLALAGFLAVTLAAGPSAVGADSNGQREGDHHYVRGTATTKIDDSVTGRVTRTFVVTGSDGAADGFIHERLREIDKNGAYTVKTRLSSKLTAASMFRSRRERYGSVASSLT